MVQTIQAQNVNIRDLIENFGLQLIEDEGFFPEWQENLPEVTETEKQLLDKVKRGFINLLNYPPLLEDVIKMAVLDPILFIADFYLAPFYVKSEQSIEIISEDEGVIIRGRLDTLVLKDQLWVMVIESKKASYSVEAGLAQLIAYMMGNPQPKQPSYGMITGGGTFTFIKLVKAETFQYGVSNIFATRNQGDLYRVLQILKHLSQIVISR
ncbi:MAG: restriction endonuclease subunit R [Lyngbya sp.]|nr:restriction endonuclease subunit R [Lyngbya sp.]